jgi:hypothetical protein
MAAEKLAVERAEVWVVLPLRPLESHVPAIRAHRLIRSPVTAMAAERVAVERAEVWVVHPRPHRRQRRAHRLIRSQAMAMAAEKVAAEKAEVLVVLPLPPPESHVPATRAHRRIRSQAKAADRAEVEKAAVARSHQGLIRVRTVPTVPVSQTTAVAARVARPVQARQAMVGPVVPAILKRAARVHPVARIGLSPRSGANVRRSLFPTRTTRTAIRTSA